MVTSAGNDIPKYMTYWETAPGSRIPPWVALAIASMRRALGDKFLLLTPSNASQYIDTTTLETNWAFNPLPFEMNSRIASIVAKSDYIRLAFVYRHGGAWLDADTLLFHDPSGNLFPNGLTEGLHWYSEALFGSKPGNPILGEAIKKGFTKNKHDWGNPGEIREIIAEKESNLHQIPYSNLDPGYRPCYNFSTCEVMSRRDVEPEDFLLAKPSLLKLYNTYFTRTSNHIESVSDFLKSGTLLSKLFLHIDGDPDYWIGEAEQLKQLVSR